MTKQQAAQLVARMLGSYSTLSLHNPEVYMPQLAATLMKYPFGVGERGSAAARKASPEFIPSVGSVEVECDKLFGSLRETATYAKEWQARTAEQLGERAEYERAPRGPIVDDRPPRTRACVFVPEAVADQFQKMKAKSQEPNVDRNDFYFGNREGRPGIWVSLGWCEKLMGGRRDSGLAHVSRYGAPV